MLLPMPTSARVFLGLMAGEQRACGREGCGVRGLRQRLPSAAAEPVSRLCSGCGKSMRAVFLIRTQLQSKKLEVNSVGFAILSLWCRDAFSARWRPMLYARCQKLQRPALFTPKPHHECHGLAPLALCNSCVSSDVGSLMKYFGFAACGIARNATWCDGSFCHLLSVFHASHVMRLHAERNWLTSCRLTHDMARQELGYESGRFRPHLAGPAVADPLRLELPSRRGW